MSEYYNKWIEQALFAGESAGTAVAEAMEHVPKEARRGELLNIIDWAQQGLDALDDDGRLE